MELGEQNWLLWVHLHLAQLPSCKSGKCEEKK